MEKAKEQDKTIKDTVEDKDGESSAQPENRQEILKDAPKRSEKFAERSFTAINYGGINWFVNSTLSLFITYNLLTTKGGQAFKQGLQKTYIQIAKGFKKLKSPFKPVEQINEVAIKENARSSVETMTTMIAGFLVLPFMKWMNDHKKEVTHKIDKVRNPKYHKYIKEKGIEPEPLPYEKKHEETQSWKELITARLIAMGTNIGLDIGVQSMNNNLATKGKDNLDTLEWKMGGKIHDKFPNFSKKFGKLFSMEGKGLEEISNRGLLEKTIGSKESSKVVFSEQIRLTSKELIQTATLTTFMLILEKTTWLGDALKKLGFKTERKQQKAIDDMLPDIPLVPITRGEIDLDGDGLIGNEKYTGKIKSVKNKLKPEKTSGSFVDRYTGNQLDQQLSPQI
ncbi:MAG: hypothetical protein R3D71_08630 [Rickettsiales bacterium]